MLVIKRLAKGVICICCVGLMAVLVPVFAGVASGGNKLTPEVSAPDRVVPDNLFHIKFVDDSRGWITGYHGTILRTDDGGASWNYIPINTEELIRRGSFPEKNTAWLVGHRGSIFHTDNAGKDWEVNFKVPGIYLRDIAFADSNNGWAVGHEGIILRTIDGGQSWQHQKISDWTKRDLPRLSGITILDKERLVITGEFGAIIYTTDSGETWQHVLLEGQPSMTAITSHGEQILAVGLDGAVAAVQFEEKGGVKAELLPLNIPTHLLDVRMTRAGVLASGYGVVVHCSAQLECQVMKPADNFPSNFLWLAGVDLAADGSVWAVGLGGYVAKAASITEVVSTEFVLGGNQWASKWANGDM